MPSRTDVTHCLPLNATKAVEEEQECRRHGAEVLGANLEAGHGHSSLPLKLSRGPTRCAAERPRKRKTEIQGSYKPKQLSPPRQPSPPRQTEPSKVRRKGNGFLEAPMGQRARRSPSHRSEASLPRSPTEEGRKIHLVPPWRGSWFNTETTLRQ